MKKFFSRGIAWMKKHPLLLVLFIGVSILIILLMRGGTGSSQTVVQTGATTDPNDAALQVHQMDTQAALTAQTQNLAAKLQATEIQADVSNRQTDVQQVLGLAGIAGQIQLADIAAQTNREQIKAATDQAQITANTYTALAHEQAATTIASYQTQEHIAGINAAQNVAMSQISANASVETAKTYASAQKHSSDMGFLGGLIGGVLSIF